MHPQNFNEAGIFAFLYQSWLYLQSQFPCFQVNVAIIMLSLFLLYLCSLHVRWTHFRLFKRRSGYSAVYSHHMNTPCYRLLSLERGFTSLKHVLNLTSSNDKTLTINREKIHKKHWLKSLKITFNTYLLYIIFTIRYLGYFKNKKLELGMLLVQNVERPYCTYFSSSMNQNENLTLLLYKYLTQYITKVYYPASIK